MEINKAVEDYISTIGREEGESDDQFYRRLGDKARRKRLELTQPTPTLVRGEEPARVSKEIKPESIVKSEDELRAEELWRLYNAVMEGKKAGDPKVIMRKIVESTSRLKAQDPEMGLPTIVRRGKFAGRAHAFRGVSLDREKRN